MGWGLWGCRVGGWGSDRGGLLGRGLVVRCWVVGGTCLGQAPGVVGWGRWFCVRRFRVPRRSLKTEPLDIGSAPPFLVCGVEARLWPLIPSVIGDPLLVTQPSHGPLNAPDPSL